MRNDKNTKKTKLQTCTLYVDGMHCASCEVLIEKKLLTQKNLKNVEASLKGNKVEINYLGEKPDINKLNQEFKDLGYEFGYKEFKRDTTPMINLKGGNLYINPKKFSNFIKLLVIFISLIVAFFIFERLQLGQYINVDSNSTLTAFFALGLVAGISSCAALIGGLLLSLIKQWNELYIDESSKLLKAQPHILFHLGRIISFIIFGGILGAIGSSISFNNPIIFAIVTILISIIMLILALQMLEVEWAMNIKIALPKSFTRKISNENNFKGRYMPFGLGALTFFLPCGFTLIAQSVALTSGSFIKGSLIMLMFALGTLIPLVGVSVSGLIFNSKPKLTANFNIIAGLVIVFFVIYNINGQLNVLGLPSLSDISIQSDSSNNSNNTQQTIINTNGKQTLSFIAKGFEYIPTSTTKIKAGVPTLLIVDNQGISGCGSFMAARGLFNDYVALKQGKNVIDLGTPRAGIYKLTCSMGMVPPVTIEVI